MEYHRKNEYHIYELFLKNDSTVQGRISVKVDGEVADVDIVETAPQLNLHNSFFKNALLTLISYYKEKLNAGVFQDRRMYIDENAAQILLDKYMRK